MSIELNLRDLPSGRWYEDRYRGYIDIFKTIALTPAKDNVTVRNPPGSWLPLLGHLRCVCIDPVVVFDHCEYVMQAVPKDEKLLDRTMVEVLCNFRPETADCLWKCDMQWNVPPGRVKRYEPTKEFIVTTNGAYHRPEVLEFMARLREYVPNKQKVLLVPCAADKPYPSALHMRCLDFLPDDYYIMNATGVLGLVPQDLWPFMPWYDSGIPNQWRLFQIISDYFTRHHHSHVVVYCDFYASTIYQAFRSIQQNQNVSCVLPPVEYDDYVNLLDASFLSKLKSTLTAGTTNADGRGRTPMDV